MRSFVALSILGFASGQLNIQSLNKCLVDGEGAVSDAMDASLFIWAATKRCGKEGDGVKCQIDISSAVKAVSSMVGVILKAVDKCGGLGPGSKACGFACNTLGKHSAGLSAALGDLVDKCPHHNGAAHSASHDPLGKWESPVMCTVDLKNTAKSIFKAVDALMKEKEACKVSGHKCYINVLDIVGAFSGIGEYLAGAVGHCKESTGSTNTRSVLCTQTIGSLVQHAAELSKAGLELSTACNLHHENATAASATKAHSTSAEPYPVSSEEPQLVTVPDTTAPKLPSTSVPVIPQLVTEDSAHASIPAVAPAAATHAHHGGHSMVATEAAVTADLPGGSATGEPAISALYKKTEHVEEESPLGFAALVLGVALPITIVVSFFGGRFYAGRLERAEQGRELFTPRVDFVPHTPRE
jgi:hypothetical protein